MRWIDWMRRIVAPLRSRKVRVALATVISTYAAQAGLHLSEEVGVALILGIAVEDHGSKQQIVSSE